MSTLDLFLDLVKIDSPSGEESLVRDYVQSYLGNLGISSSVDSAGNLFARITGIGNPRILSAHLDTVEPGRGIQPRVENGRVTSGGTTILGADNKVAVAAFLTALSSVPPAGRRALELVLSVREETDGGISDFDFSQLHSRIGLIADRSAPVGTVVLSSPWIENLAITLTGLPAHAGLPEQGINALAPAATSLARLRWGRIDTKTTANIGLISGGSSMNTVPARVELVGEVRSFSPKLLARTLTRIHDVFTAVSLASQVELDFTRRSYCAGYVYTAKSPGVAAVASAMSALGLSAQFQTSFGGSDANTFAAHGIQVVNTGDGTVHPHTTQESVTVKSLDQLTSLVRAYISI